MKIIFKYLGPVNEQKPISILLLINVSLMAILIGIKYIFKVFAFGFYKPKLFILTKMFHIVIIFSVLLIIFVAIWQIFSIFSLNYSHYQCKTFHLRRNLQVDPGENKNVNIKAPYTVTPVEHMNKYISRLIIYPDHNSLVVRIPLPFRYAESIADRMNDHFKSNNNYDSLNKFFSNNFHDYYIRFHHYKLGNHNRFMYWSFFHK